MFDPTNINAVLVSGWIETNPAVGSVNFGIDESNPIEQPIQVVTENLKNDEVYVADNIYRKMQSIRLTITLKPIYYDPAYLITAKETFYNVIAEVDRILVTMRALYPAIEYDLKGWGDIDIPKGFGTQDEPLTFKTAQDIVVRFY